MSEEKSMEKTSLRSFVMDMWTAQIGEGDTSLSLEPVVAAILRDPDMTASAVGFAVMSMRQKAGKLIRGKAVRHRDESSERGGAATRFVKAIVDYGLSLLDVEFGGKPLGDYLPDEALAYAKQQHESARTVALQARFVMSVAKACADPLKPIREQLTNERVEAIRMSVIESSPNKDAAEIALAVA